MNYDILQDLSDITTVPKAQLQTLFDKIILFCCHDVVEQLKEGNTKTELDLYFGKLYVLVEDETVKYKFIPSKKFERQMSESAITLNSPLTKTIETLLSERLTNTYKDLF